MSKNKEALISTNVSNLKNIKRENYLDASETYVNNRDIEDCIHTVNAIESILSDHDTLLSFAGRNKYKINVDDIHVSDPDCVRLFVDIDHNKKLLDIYAFPKNGYYEKFTEALKMYKNRLDFLEKEVLITSKDFELMKNEN